MAAQSAVSASRQAPPSAEWRNAAQRARPAAIAPETFATPPLLPNQSHTPGLVEVTLTAAPARLELLPGRSTAAYAYNGQVPGPTLELREGDRVVVHFRNQLPEATTIHWHGLHLPATSDGSPLNPVPPGGAYDYRFTVPPGTAGTYWYHPHPDMRGGFQLGSGLYGAVIVRAADDPLRALPERLLILADNRFLPDGSMDFPDPQSARGGVDAENGREGDVVFVNGRVLPSLTLRAGEVERWRVINASAARVYRLAIPGRTLLQVGSDGGLFERPAAVNEVVLANSERVELLVRGDGEPGDTATLQSLPYDRYVPQTRPADWNRALPLVALRYATPAPLVATVGNAALVGRAGPRGAPSIPVFLRAVPALDTTAAVRTQVVVLSQGLINGRTMDMERVDLRAKLGTTEIWQIENVVGMDHPFHLHGFRFQVLDRDGVPEPFRSWKDTVNVPKHQVVRIIVRYDDYPGKWMFHCHIMDHEDMGMMGILEVR